MVQQRRITASYNASMAGSARPLNDLRRPLSENRRQAEGRAASASSVPAGDFKLHSASEVNVGTRIRHTKFGVGLVTELDTSGVDARMTVEFESDDIKSRTLLFKYAKFMIL